MNTIPTLARSLALGFACGLRSVAGPTALAFNHGRQECFACAPAPLRLMRSDPARLGLAAAAFGELIVDKTPLAQPRTALVPLGGRIAFGGLTGYLAARATRTGRSPAVAALGAILGGAGAAIGAFAGFNYRRLATSSTGLPDWPVAVVEDALAYGTATLAARS